MRLSQAHQYVTRSKRRQRIIESLITPLTATQISRKTGLRADACRHVIGELARHGLIECKNECARRSRLYGLTELGLGCWRRFKHPAPATSANVDWELYGWVCYRHRSTILKTMTEPMQPATIKRKARSRDPTLRMSANNVRDVMRLFLRRGIVKQVWVRKKAHPRYELTENGKILQSLLLRAEEVA